MDFNTNRPIYLQIVDSLCDRILCGDWKEQERIPSVRELSASIGVNPNTIARVYDHLQNKDIIYNKRGIGYFICDNAKEYILKEQKEEFITSELPSLFKKMKLLNITLSDLEQLFKTM